MKTKGLTLPEAIASGLAFRRPHGIWMKVKEGKLVYHDGASCSLSHADSFTANDYELKVEPRTWTRHRSLVHVTDDVFKEPFVLLATLPKDTGVRLNPPKFVDVTFTEILE